MAKIERYVAGVQAPSGRGISIPQFSYEGTEALGRGISAFGQAIKQAKQVSLLSSLKIGLAREMSDLGLEYDERQDYEKFGDISGRLEKTRQKYLEKIGNDNEVMQAFMPQFEMSAINLETGIKKLSREKFVRSDQAALTNEMDNVVELAGRRGQYETISSSLRAMGHAAIAGRAASGVIDPVAAENLSNDLDSRLWDNYFTAQAKSNPIKAAEDLRNDSLFPGMNREKRLHWQGIMDEDAEKKRIEDTGYSLIATHKTDFNGMYSELASNKDLSRHEVSKIQDMIGVAEKEYNQRLDEARKEGKKQELDNIFKMVGDLNLIGALKAVEDSEFLDEEERFNKSESLKNWGQRELWNTNPELEAKLTKRIESGDITETDIEFQRGMGLSNDDTDKLKNRLKNKGKDPVKSSIINDAVSYAKTRWTTDFPKDEGLGKHFSYIKFQNQIQDELEAMAKDKPLTRAEAAKHVDEYFKLKIEVKNWWPDKDYFEAQNLAESYTAEEAPGSKVPEPEYKKIEQYLNNKGLSSSQADIEKIYNQNKDKPGYQKLIGGQQQEDKSVVRKKIPKGNEKE
jgi:hypothetical protein